MSVYANTAEPLQQGQGYLVTDCYFHSAQNLYQLHWRVLHVMFSLLGTGTKVQPKWVQFSLCIQDNQMISSFLHVCCLQIRVQLLTTSLIWKSPTLQLLSSVVQSTSNNEVVSLSSVPEYFYLDPCIWHFYLMYDRSILRGISFYIKVMSGRNVLQNQVFCNCFFLLPELLPPESVLPVHRNQILSVKIQKLLQVLLLPLRSFENYQWMQQIVFPRMIQNVFVWLKLVAK